MLADTAAPDRLAIEEHLLDRLPEGDLDAAQERRLS
jgi:hypothetical protein